MSQVTPFSSRIGHPRAYGNFARLLGKYVRAERIIPLEEAIRRMTSLPPSNLKLEGRGSLETGYFADVVDFDPERIQDHADYETPHQYSTGVLQFFVSGQQVLKHRGHTRKSSPRTGMEAVEGESRSE